MTSSFEGRALAALRIFLVVLSLIHAGTLARDFVVPLSEPDGLPLADGGHPAGGDFINMFAAGSLAANGRVADVYEPTAFADFQRTLIPTDIGLRLWAYPPTSLLVAAPLALAGFWVGFIGWSALGLVVLVAGTRRMGLSWLDSALVALSPAALICVVHGQTGNLAIGLLLIALSAVRKVDAGSALAAALLTIKPQLGLLLPVVWLIQRRLKLMALTTGLTLALAGVATLVFGPQSWVDYVTKTLPVLEHLEMRGDGPFVAMIPSVFMSLRIVTQDPELAKWVHIAFAAIVFAGVALRCAQMRDPVQQSCTVLVAAALITPYIHIYDLAGVFCALLACLGRLAAAPAAAKLGAAVAVLAAWGLPLLTVAGNVALVPLGPPVLLGLLAVVAWRIQPAAAVAEGGTKG